MLCQTECGIVKTQNQPNYDGGFQVGSIEVIQSFLRAIWKSNRRDGFHFDQASQHANLLAAANVRC